ncbi:MAG: hypothetical protein OEV76_09380 [Anaerolineae bacterium]|nr:hypothetical protein [Anaerolineae bacterium]
MELAWQLRGYAINICILRRREAPIQAECTEEQVVEPAPPQRRSEVAHEDLLRASGSRFVGPIR